MERLLKVRTGRQPHEISVMIAAILGGVLGVLFPEGVSPAISSLLPEVPTQIFFGMMAAFGVIVLVSMVKRTVDALLLERAGLFVLAFCFTAFALAIFVHSGFAGALSSVLPLAFAGANVWRVLQIGYDLKLLKSYLSEHSALEAVIKEAKR